MTVSDLAKMIDHSLLHPTMTEKDLTEGCLLAARYQVASVCIKPYAVPLACRLLAGSGVAVGTVIGFPHGGNTTGIKVAEALEACALGATEIDMVVNIGQVLGGEWSAVQREIEAVHVVSVSRGALVKVIFENDFLSLAAITKLTELCNGVGVAFVKTSTGYGFVKQPDGQYNYKGATVEHLKLMRQVALPAVQVKAAGGVRTLKDLVTVRSLGVTRVGATATAVMLDEAKKLLAEGVDLNSLISG
ncbi:MAG: deoxyribose-phosphate aldolase [Spirochaetales bacterium]